MTTRLGLCPQCRQTTLEYENVYRGGSGYVDTLHCPACQFFINARQPDYDRVHNQAFPAVTADEKRDRRASQIERVVGIMSPAGALPLAVGGERP